MNKRFIALGLIVLAIATSICLAGIRGPGKYTGVVIFDRWGGCTLYSGIYVMYVSEGVKEKLRPYAGKCVQIDATQVEQRINPGDGLIKAFRYLGAAPAVKDWESPAGLKLSVQPTFHDGEMPSFELRLENCSTATVTVHVDTFAPTVLARRDRGGARWAESDGPSSAVITRDSFWVSGSRTEGANDTWHWTVTRPAAFDQKVRLQPKVTLTVELSLRLPAGEYEFLAGYGGGVHEGQCIASDLIAIDVVKDGTASLVKVSGR